MAHNVYSDAASDIMGGNKQITQIQAPQGARDCSICYNAMTSKGERIPRLLTCGHTFCTECIRTIEANSDFAYTYNRRRGEVLCPHCKFPTAIPNGDVTKLPKNFIFLDIISEQPSLPRIQMNVETIKCNIHNIVKKSYCFNCQELVCPYCQMSNHQTHNCEITIEAIKVFLPDFKQHQEMLEAFSQQLSSAKDRFETTVNHLRENHEQASHNINTRFTAIIDEATKWRTINIRKLDDILKEREDILDQQIHSIDAVITETKGKLELAQHITSPQNEEQFFVHYKEIGNDSKDIMSRELGLNPLVHEHIEWRVSAINHVIDKMSTIAFVNEDPGAVLAIEPTANPAASRSNPVYPDTSLDQPISVIVTHKDMVSHKPTTQPISNSEENLFPAARPVLHSTHPMFPPPRFGFPQSSSLPHSSSQSQVPSRLAQLRPNVPSTQGYISRPSTVRSAVHGNVHYPN